MNRIDVGVESEEAFGGLFRPDPDAMRVLRSSLKESGEADAETVDSLVDALSRRPLLRWFVMRKIREEANAAGFSVPLQGRVDWEAIAEFIKAIAPVILEILMLFL